MALAFEGISSEEPRTDSQPPANVAGQILRNSHRSPSKPLARITQCCYLVARRNRGARDHGRTIHHRSLEDGFAGAAKTGAGALEISLACGSRRLAGQKAKNAHSTGLFVSCRQTRRAQSLGCSAGRNAGLY